MRARSPFAAFRARLSRHQAQFLAVLSATETAVRISTETRAGRPQADVCDGTTTVVPLKQEGLVLQWLPDTAKDYPPDRLDAEGYWIATNISVLTPGFNTSVIARGREPRNYAALLDPKWRGQIGWGGTPSTSAGPGFVGTVLAEMGEEQGRAYLKGFAKQKPANPNISANAVLKPGDPRRICDRASAVQQPRSAEATKKGAPVQWIAIEPTTVVLNVLSVLKAAPHPNAGKLLVDFLTSPQGQVAFRDIDYIPAHPAVAPLDATLAPDGGKFRARYFTPEQSVAEMPRWKSVFDDLFR